MSFLCHARISLIVPIVLVGLSATGCAPAAKQPPAAAKTASKDEHDHDHAEAAKKPDAKPAAKDAKSDGDHADHKHPETLAEGVAELETLVGTVKEHLKADAKEKADDAVHLIGHLLEDVEKLVPAAKLSAEAETAAKKAVEELYACFDKLDTALHAEAGKGDSPGDVHKQVAEKIEAAIKQLKSAKPAQSETAKPAADAADKK